MQHSARRPKGNRPTNLRVQRRAAGMEGQRQGVQPQQGGQQVAAHGGPHVHSQRQQPRQRRAQRHHQGLGGRRHCRGGGEIHSQAGQHTGADLRQAGGMAVISGGLGSPWEA